MVDRITVDIPAEQMAARAALGLAIRNWFHMNRWSQDVPGWFAKAKDLNGPWNSQMSLLYNGRLDPKAQFFLALEEFNLAVAYQNLDEEELEPKLVKRLHAKQPFLTETGEFAKAEDFFAMFIGRKRWHEMFDAIPRLSEEEAENRGKILLRNFESLMLDQMITRAELWRDMQRDPAFCAAVEEAGHDPKRVQRWLLGIDTYSPELHADFGEALEAIQKSMKAP